MLLIKLIGLLVCVVVAGRWKRARLPLVLLVLAGALLLRGLQCGHDPAMDPDTYRVPAGAAGDILGPFVPKGPIKPTDCTDRPNCIPPPAPPDAGP
jgi:hypothetical protein